MWSGVFLRSAVGPREAAVEIPRKGLELAADDTEGHRVNSLAVREGSVAGLGPGVPHAHAAVAEEAVTGHLPQGVTFMS